MLHDRVHEHFLSQCGRESTTTSVLKFFEARIIGPGRAAHQGRSVSNLTASVGKRGTAISFSTGGASSRPARDRGRWAVALGSGPRTAAVVCVFAMVS